MDLSNDIEDKSATMIIAHCDDECLGGIHLFKRNKIKRLIVITDSAVQLTEPFVNTSKYIEKRREETSDFCASYGIRDIAFLNYPAGFLHKLSSKSIQTIYEYIAGSCKTSKSIVTHSYLDPHIDHKIISGIVSRVIANKKKIAIRMGFACTSYKEMHIGSRPLIKDQPLQKKEFEEHMVIFRRYYLNQYKLLMSNGFDFNLTMQGWETNIDI